MCLAIVALKSKSNIENIRESVKNAWEANPHGAGYSFASHGVVHVRKGFMSVRGLMKRLAVDFESYSDTSDFHIHLRYASAGDKSNKNCHPFISGKSAVIHNGTITKYCDPKINESDTSLFAKDLSKLPTGWQYNNGFQLLVGDVIGTSKVAVLDADGKTVLFNFKLWQEVDGIFYSNDYFKSGVKRVAAVPYDNYENYENWTKWRSR